MTGSMAQTLGQAKKKIAGISRQRSSLDAERHWRYDAMTDDSNKTPTVVRWRDPHLCSFCESFLRAVARTNLLGSPESIPQTRPSLKWNYPHKMVIIFASCGWNNCPSTNEQSCMAVCTFNSGFGRIGETLE